MGDNAPFDLTGIYVWCVHVCMRVWVILNYNNLHNYYHFIFTLFLSTKGVYKKKKSDNSFIASNRHAWILYYTQTRMYM